MQTQDRISLTLSNQARPGTILRSPRDVHLLNTFHLARDSAFCCGNAYRAIVTDGSLNDHTDFQETIMNDGFVYDIASNTSSDRSSPSLPLYAVQAGPASIAGNQQLHQRPTSYETSGNTLCGQSTVTDSGVRVSATSNPNVCRPVLPSTLITRLNLAFPCVIRSTDIPSTLLLLPSTPLINHLAKRQEE